MANTGQSHLHVAITIPPSYIWVHPVVCDCGEGQTDTQTAVTTTYFASAAPHAKCNDTALVNVTRRW